MKQCFRLMFLIGLLLLSLTLPLAAQDEGGPPQVGLRPDAPAYAVHGPYWVGTQEFVIDPDAERPIPLTVWYPALNPENKTETITYKPIMTWTPMPEADYEVFGHALLNAPPNAADEPYPLIVFSHGYATFPSQYAFLLEHLASYGFMVVAPLHGERFYFDEDPWRDTPQTTIDRPRDIVKVLDYAGSLNESNDMFKGLIDMEQVAVAGHSYGGYTTLAAAGARYDLQAYNADCTEVSEAIAENMLCDNLVPYEDEMAQLAGLDALPEGLWPSMGDPRVKAIVPLAGDAYLFEKAGLSEITVPMLAMGGTLDDSTPYAWGARLAYDDTSSKQKSLVTIESGNHYVFLAQCTDIPWLLDMESFWFCSDAVWDMGRAHDLVNHFATAFLLDTLKGDTDAHAALLAENVSFAGITYETTMK